MIEPLKINAPEEENEFSINIEEYLIDPDEEIEEPIPILSIRDGNKLIPIMTEDNISMIQGKAKSRKSTLLKAIGTAILKNGYQRLISKYNRNNAALLDTEQGKYHCWKAAWIIKQLSGKKLTYYRLSELSVSQKKFLVEEHLKNNPDCGFMILDNIAHFLINFNDPTESAELVLWLIYIKSTYNCHLLLILHENASEFGNGKAKGHLGSLLEQYCETIIRVEKDKNDKNRSIVSAKETRGLDFEKFTIEMDYQGVPYLNDYEEESPTHKNFKL